MIFIYAIYVILMYLFYPLIFIVFSIMMLFNKPIRKGALSRLGFIYPKENNKNAKEKLEKQKLKNSPEYKKRRADRDAR